MTRAECERKLIELAEQADRVYREYTPEGNGISISTNRDGYISVSDIDVDQKTKEITCWTLEGAKNQEGEVYSLDFPGMTINREVESE